MDNMKDQIVKIMSGLNEENRILVLCFAKRLRYLEEQYSSGTR